MSSLLSVTQRDLLSHFDFALCSSEEQLRESYKLRVAVFHNEQGFPAETEVDEYDPISAHFLVVRRSDGMTVATVRLTPYPRKPWLADAPSADGNEPLPLSDMAQNETSVVTSGGGPGGTSGGLPMFSTKDDDKAEQATKTKGTPAETSDDATARKQYPLGRPLPQAELARRFIHTVQSTDPIDEEHGAPCVRGAKVSRLAVAKSERGKHLGALVMQQVEGWLLSLSKKLDAKGAHAEASDAGSAPTAPFSIVVSSQKHAVPFYKKLGYKAHGEEFDEEGAPHLYLYKTSSSPLPVER